MRERALLITSFILFSFATGVLAQAAELPNPGITPDSPFYFFDNLGKKVNLFFTFDPVKKVEKAVSYAEEKIAESKAMAEKNKPEAIEKANQGYQEFLDLANAKTQEAKEQGRDVEELATFITEKTLKHQEVLVEVFEKVPEEVKDAIKKAIEVSRTGSEEAVKAVTGEKETELLRKIEGIKAQTTERIKALEEELKKAKERIREFEKVLEEREKKTAEISESIEPPAEKAPEVVKKSTTLTYPNGGEELIIGETYTIRWKSTGVEMVEISLQETSFRHASTIAKDIQASLGEFNWKIEEKIPLGRYEIYIWDGKDARTIDKSDGNFIIKRGSLVCTDSDGGKNYYTKGQVYGKASDSVFRTIDDFCLGRGSKDVVEYFCGENNYYSSEHFTCQYGCNNGACLERIISVISPNGGEKLQMGKTYDITWVAPDTYSSVLVDIVLWYDNYSVKKIASGVPITASQYSWTISSFLTIGEKYRINIAIPEVASDFSDDYFSITKEETKSITVTSPDGGERWLLGSTHDVAWQSSGIEEYVSVIVKYSANAAVSVCYVPAKTGQCSWTIDKSIYPTGNDYKILIQGKDALGNIIVSDYSNDYFSIIPATAPSINIYVPEGEKLVKGYKSEPSWCGENLLTGQKGFSNLYLLKGVVSYGLIAKDITISDGYIGCPFWSKYSWDIGKLADGSMAPDGTDYKFRVELMDINVKLIVQDESDNYFSIVTAIVNE